MGYFQMTRNVEEIFGGVVTAPHQIPFTYTSTNGGETFLSLPFYPTTGFITINGGVQVPLDNFELDGNTLNLGRELEPGDVVYCLFDKIMSPQDINGATKIYKFISEGGETQFTPDFSAYGVQSLYIQGLFKAPVDDYQYSWSTGVVTLTNPLPANALVVAEMFVKQNVEALANPSGSNNIGIETGGVLSDALKYVTPEMMRVDGDRYLHGITPDAVKFLQAALDYGKANKLPNKWSKMYPCTTAPVLFDLPYDDGTVYPGWVGNGDENIAPETPVKAKAALRAYDDTVIIGDYMHNCGIIGNFSKTVGPWDHSSPMGIYVSGDNGPDQYVKYFFANIRISSFFIGLWVDGTVNRCVEHNTMISGCAIPSCYQGSDSLAQTGLTLYWYNLGGPVFGGRWLTRNHAYASTYLPPYPASDIHRAGWNDSYHCEKFHYYGDTSMDWDHPAYAATDSWFNTFVFKSANTLPTASGGRLSNNQQSGVYPVDTYRGVVGRARTIISLYGREVLSCNILEAKVLWSPRTPFYQSAQFVGGAKSYVGNSKIGQVILERVGIIKYSLGDVPGNRFNVDNVDPWDNTQTTFPAMATRGNIFALDIVKGGAVQTSVINEFTGTTIGAGMNFMSQRPTGDTANYRLLGLQERLGNNVTDLYAFNKQYAFMQKILFGSSGALFSYDYGTFTPVVTIAGVAITLTEAIGVWHRFGDNIRVHIRLRNSSLTVNTAGPFSITGLPFTAGTVQTGYTKGNVFTGAATGKTLIPLVTPATKTLTILADSSGATFQHPTGTIDFTLHAEFDYLVSFNS